MRKILLYILFLSAALILPQKDVDVGKLIPVELIQLDRKENLIVLSTDAGISGIGESVEAAAENMHDTTAGVVFLDTADFLVVAESAKQDIETIKEYLKPSVRLCALNAGVDLKEAAAFLGVHKPHCRLRDWEDGLELELLTNENGRLILKNEKI